ncbi:unnamed protein product [Owenia fusiformis]|uniref:Uncharacterized protein n=1 Tax=Owenia fusiformis TaxID=6347 RepID=A0A8J1U9B5_OWEFU|nr:unnamed protein product [Owenia fusiformis]
MAKVNIVNVTVLSNPTNYSNTFEFEITFECLEDLPEDLEWKLIYVGSAESEKYDQTLDSVLVGPVPGGKHKFVFEADPPDTTQIPTQDIVGVTVILLTCSYRGKEFIRVGYYVNNEYSDPEMKENPPVTPEIDKLQRNILATDPRVTRFKIDWDDSGTSQQENAENNPPIRMPENESNLLPPSTNGINTFGGPLCSDNRLASDPMHALKMEAQSTDSNNMMETDQ